MQRVETGEIWLWRQGWGGRLLTEAATECHKQWSAKSELLEACYHGGHAWLKGAHAAKWGGVPARSKDPRGPKKNGWCHPAALFPRIIARKPAGSCGSWCQLSALFRQKLNHQAVMQPLSWDRPANGKSATRPYPGGIAWICAPESPKLGVLKLSHMPEIKKLGHRQGEPRVQTETGDTSRGLDCSPRGLTEEPSSTPGLESGAPSYSSHPSALKAFREQNGAT